MPNHFALQDFPEELLEHILALCLVASPSPTPVRRAPWHTPGSRRTSPLLVCRIFNRIGTPLLYHNVRVTDSEQATLLLRTLRVNPSISPLIRCLYLPAITIQTSQILSLCRRLHILDFTLDSARSSAPGSQIDSVDPSAIEFCNALMTQRHLRHLVVRKPDSRAYLTMPRIKYILWHLADALLQWNNLETANFSFKFADDSSASHQAGPIVRLTHALSTRPRLHTFAAHVPATWSAAILRVSANKRLERIVLTDGRADISIVPGIIPYALAPATEQQGGILGTGLFFMEARKHIRLIELIKAGTPFVRCRARSLDHPATQTVPARVVPVTLVSTRSADSLSSPASSVPPPSSSHTASAKLPKRKKLVSSSRPLSSPLFQL